MKREHARGVGRGGAVGKCGAVQRDPLKAAIHRLEKARSLVAEENQRAVSRCAGELLKVRRSFQEHVRSTEAPDGLLADVGERQPRLVPHVQRMRDTRDELAQRLETLAAELAGYGQGPVNVGKAQEEFERLLGEMHGQRIQRADLWFEAYCTDLGGPG